MLETAQKTDTSHSVWLLLAREARRRGVFRAASVYAVGAWFIVQLVSELNDPLKIPDWVDSSVVLLLIVGFPVVLALGWIYRFAAGEGLDAQGLAVRTSHRVQVLASALWSCIAVAAVLLAANLMRHVEPEIDPFQGLVDVSDPVPGFSGRAAIAVLPFRNLSDDAEQDYFADGITEDLITALQSYQSFPIIARASTFQYKAGQLSLEEIAGQLGAGYIVEGSIRKVGGDVRINVQLSRPDGRQLWADSDTYEFKDALHIQDKVVDRIIHAIEPQLIITEADRARFVRTEDMEAWDYYLQALTNTYAPFAFTDLNGQYVSAERLDKARELLFKAVELDPNFASAWRLLNHVEGAFVFNLAHLIGPDEAREKVRLAIEYGEKARLISPFEPGVCSCQSAMLLMSGDVDGAYQLQAESLKHNPSNAVAHAMMGKILQVRGEYPSALKSLNLAKRLSPRGMAMTSFLYFEAATWLAMSEFDQAISAADKSLLLVPGNYDAAIVRLLALVGDNRLEDARGEIERLRRIVPKGARPASGWTEPFPRSVASATRLLDGTKLVGLSFNDGLDVVLHMLHW